MNSYTIVVSYNVHKVFLCHSNKVFCLAPITLSGHCHPQSASHEDVLSNWITDEVTQGQVRGINSQVRVFNMHIRASCCSARLSWAQVPPVPLSGTRKKRGEGCKGGPPALVGTREYEQSN